MEKTIIVSHFRDQKNISLNDEYVKELKSLVEAAGGTVVGSVVQIRDNIESSTYIGTGKAEEIRLLVDETSADLVVFNDELSGSQTRNLAEIIGVKVIDRTALILDIFANRATTKIAKLQVELAELKYKLPRLTGYGASMSRLGGASSGGGIASRGLGEQKLELDKRVIRRRISDLENQIQEAKSSRDTQRRHRDRNEIPVVSIVGYTNAGKSTLMNYFMNNHAYALSQNEKTVFEKDMLFATLDTHSRKVVLEDKKEFILVDTVGFVSKLPHTLVAAFQSTLEEAVFADLIVEVIDGSNPNYSFQVDVTRGTLDKLGAGGIDIIYAYNKSDKFSELPLLTDPSMSVFISAKHGDGMHNLINMISDNLFGDRLPVKLLLPYELGAVASQIQNKYSSNVLEYRQDGVYIEATVDRADFERYAEFIVN